MSSQTIVLGPHPKEATLPFMLFASFVAHILGILFFLVAPQFLPHGKKPVYGGPSGAGGLHVMTVDFSLGQPEEKEREEPAPARYLKKVTEEEETELPSKTEFPEQVKKKKNEPPAAKETLNQPKRKVEGPYGKGTDTSKEAGKPGHKGIATFGTGEGGPGGFGTGTGIPFPFPWYIEQVLTKLEISWAKPYLAETEPREYSSVVYFEILRNGQVRNVEVEESSGIPALDRSAESAVLGAAPFPPLPTQWTEPELAFRIKFTHTQ